MLGTSRKTLDIFISHAWRYHEDWNRFSNMLDAHDSRAWRNFSLPWYDPALNPASEYGGEQLRWNLESQIIPVHAMILLSSVFAQQGSIKWINFEIEIARKHSKPIIALPVGGETSVLPQIAEIADAAGMWDAAGILSLIEQVSVTSRGERTATINGAGAPG
jgi:hypothetical protein